jgi:HPt (histidine-containing phosphotransfer) domain-containing protein
MNGSTARRTSPEQATPGALGDVLDLDHLARQTLNDPDLEREVVAMFFEQSAQVLRQIWDAGEHRQRMEAAHRLKGSARAVGAWRVAEASGKVEALPAHAPDDHVLEAVAGLHAKVAEARAVIAGLLDQEGAAAGL